METAPLNDLQPRGYKLFKILRPNADRVVDPDLWQLAVLAELVNPPGADGELLRDLRDPEQPVAAAPEHPQVRQRGRHARDWRPLLPTAALFRARVGGRRRL
jgi:hypothetical protein